MSNPKPIRASQVPLSTEKSPDEVRRERIHKAVEQRQNKRRALKNLGADIVPSSADLHARLEYGLKKIDKQAGRNGAARKAANAKLQGK